MSHLHSGSSFISQSVQSELDGKVALVSATKQTIGSALDVSGTINIPTGSEFQINGVAITAGGGGGGTPTIDTLVITNTGLTLSQTDITYIIGYTHNFYGATLELNSENLPAGKTKTIIATELNGKIVIILDRLGNPISPNLTKNGQQQTFQWSGTDWTYDDNKITTNLLGWGGELGLPSNNNTTIQSELQQSGDINLLTGKKYKINSVNLEAVAETLSNKTISGTSNTILNLPISSSTGLQTALDGKVALVSATTQSIGSALDVSGNINLTAGSEFQINGVPIGGGGSNLPTIDTLFVDGSIENFSQTDITYIIGSVISNHIALNNFYDFPAGKTKTIIAEELNGKIVLILTDGGIALSPGLSKNGQQQTFLWDGTKWTYDDNKITTRLVGWGTTPLTPPNSNTTIQSELQESGDINLLTGKKYKINSVNLEAVAETLSNKTISGTSNTILNLPISSTTGLQTALDGKVALVSATKQTIGSALDVSGNINLPTGSQYQINGVSITAGGGGGGTPGGVEGSVQYNASGAFAGESDFNYSASTNTLTLTNGTLRPSVINFNSDNIAISGNSAMIGQSIFAVAIGDGAGAAYQSGGAVAIGHLAGNTNQGEQCIAIGSSAGGNQNDYSIAIGSSAGGNQNDYSIAIGSSAGGNQYGYGIAIGSGAGGGQNNDCIAIGRGAGGTNGQGVTAIAIGATAGANAQGVNCLAIGANSGSLLQKENSIAIGYGAGQERQGAFNNTGNGIAIGYEAGNTEQGTNAIAIGYKAGKFYQANQSICINATGDNLDAQTENSLFIKPIRNETNLSGFLQLYYNPTTGELVYN